MARWISSLFAALIFAGMPVSALAAPPAHDSGGSRGGEGAVRSTDIELYNSIDAAADALMDEFGEDETCPRNVDVPSIVIPIAADGRLFGYAFVTPRICLARGVSESRFIAQQHFMVDAMIRAGHAHPFVLHRDGAIDREDTRTHLLAALETVASTGQIERLDLLGADIRPVR